MHIGGYGGFRLLKLSELCYFKLCLGITPETLLIDPIILGERAWLSLPFFVNFRIKNIIGFLVIQSTYQRFQFLYSWSYFYVPPMCHPCLRYVRLCQFILLVTVLVAVVGVEPSIPCRHRKMVVVYPDSMAYFCSVSHKIAVVFVKINIESV